MLTMRHILLLTCGSLLGPISHTSAQSSPVRQPDGTNGLLSPLSVSDAIYSDAHGSTHPTTVGTGLPSPGINALSIATRILPEPFFLRQANMFVPSNRQAPIAAHLTFATAGNAEITMDLDWRETGDQTWDIRIDTDEGLALLSGGGARLSWNGRIVAEGEDREYRDLYADLVRLVTAGGSDIQAPRTATPFKAPIVAATPNAIGYIDKTELDSSVKVLFSVQ